MPGRRAQPSKPRRPITGGGGQIGQAPLDPCMSQRDPLDVPGRINDLINCYLSRLIPWAVGIFPLIVLAVILIAIMLISAYKVIKD